MAGAAEGLGAAYSKVLAQQHTNLILVDKNEDTLNSLIEELNSSFSIDVMSISVDLSLEKSIDLMMDRIKQTGCRFVVYNAAYGPVKAFLENSVDELNYYLDVNSRTPMHLLHRLIKEHKEKDPVGFLQMASLAGMWGTNLVAPYAATKAFNQNLSEGLYHELKSYGIDIMACVAGATDTPNFRTTQPKNSFLSPKAMDPEKVVTGSLKRLGKRAYYIPGFTNKMTVFLLGRILGRRIALRVMNKTMQRMYKK